MLLLLHRSLTCKVAVNPSGTRMPDSFSVPHLQNAATNISASIIARSSREMNNRTKLSRRLPFFVFLEYLKVELEAEPSGFRSLFCGISSQFWFWGRDTLPTLKINLKTFKNWNISIHINSIYINNMYMLNVYIHSQYIAWGKNNLSLIPSNQGKQSTPNSSV